MQYKIPPFPKIAVGNDGARWPANLSSTEAGLLEPIHKQLRVDVSKLPDRFEELVCRAVQQCYDVLKRINDRRDALNLYVLEHELPEKTLKIGLDCGWLPPGARAEYDPWRAWITELLAGRFSRVGLADSCEPDPYLFVPFPVVAVIAGAGSPMTVMPSGQKRTSPGPVRGLEAARKVAEIVARLANGQRWKGQLDEICDALDEARVPCPKTWHKKGISGWLDAADGSDTLELAKKAIEHHLKNNQRT